MKTDVGNVVVVLVAVVVVVVMRVMDGKFLI